MIDVGTGAAAREVTSLSRNNEERTIPGLLIGEVMWGPGSPGYDDSSVKTNGLIKVYIPNYCDIPRGEDYTTASATWITCYPILPLSGANPGGGDGDGAAYGFHFTPRRGDWVAVMFSGSNSRDGYWFGCVPPSMKARSGAPDAPAVKVKGEENNLPAGESLNDEKPNYTISQQTKEAGLLADELRGVTPPQSKIDNKVVGLRSYGNPNEGRIGHQMSMYDDKDFSMMRFRTSDGAQLILSDAGKFLYFNTQSGKCWMEMHDDGRLDIYAASSISIHTKEDFNLAVGRDFNIDVGRDMNVRVKDVLTQSIGSDYNQLIGGDYLGKADGSYHLSAGSAMKMKSSTIDIASSGKAVLGSGGEFHVAAGSNVKINAAGGGSIYEQGGADSPSDPSEPIDVPLTIVPGDPTPDQYREGKSGGDVEMVGGRDGSARYPMHEPWSPDRSNIGEPEVPETTGVYTAPPPKGSNPATYRNNNPGALMWDGSTQWVGMTGTEELSGGRQMVQFESVETGVRAQTLVLNSYAKRGQNTIDEIMDTYSTTDQTAYKNYLAEKMGIGIHDEIDMSDYDQRFKLQKSMILFEGGGDYFSDAQISKGINLGGITREGSGQSVGSPISFKSLVSRIAFRSIRG